MYQTFTLLMRKMLTPVRVAFFVSCLLLAGNSFAQVCTPTINNHCCNIGAVKVELDNGSAFSQSTTWSSSQYYFNYYNSVQACIAPGSSYNLDVTVGPTYNHAVCIWVDWDQDNVFDSSEKIDSTTSINSNSVFSTTLNVPSGLSAGGYRMRVLCDYYYYYSNNSAIFNPCNAGATYTYGNWQDFQLYVPSSNEDAKMVAITAPSVLTTGNNNVSVNIKNMSSTSIDSVRVSYQLDNGSIVEEQITGLNLQTCASYTYQFSTALNISTGGTYILKAWVKYPNGIDPDDDASNDSAQRLVCTGLSGNYTVDPSQSASATNFQSMADMANALNTCGISGPVTFTVAAGTYNENIKINNVTGSSSTNTVTIDGQDNTTTTITSNSAYTIQLDNASFITIKNLEIENTSTGQMTALHLTNQSDWNYFDSLLVEAPTNNYSATAYGIMGSNSYSYGQYGNNNTMEHSTIKGGYYTIVVNGQSGNKAHGNIVQECSIENSNGYAMYNAYNDTLSFIHNKIKTNYDYFYYCDNVDFSRNTVEINNYGYPIYGFYCSNFNIINNHMSGNNMYYGMYLYYLTTANIYHNSLYSTYSYSYGTYLYQGSNIDMRNNNFWMDGTNSYGIYVQNAGNFLACEYNNYWCPKSNNIAYIGQAYANMNALKGANGINNILYNQAPNYVNVTSTPYDLHLTSTVMGLFGDGSVGVTIDIDGDTRCSMAPSVGCDESTYPITLPTSNFSAPDTVYMNSPVKFLNSAGINEGKVFDWGVDASFGMGNTHNFTYSFTSSGLHTVSLITTNCAGSDTIDKNIYVTFPTAKPSPDFLANINTIESNDIVSFQNLTSGGDTAWYWTVSPGTQGVDWDFANGTDAYSYAPDIQFVTEGKYTICLQAWNSVGDDQVCKNNYIEVIPVVNMCATSYTNSSKGRFYDDGGKSSNYASSNQCDLLIDPCASTLTLTFTKFNTYTNYGYLRVWDGKDKTTGKALHTGLGWTGTSSPGTLVAKSGKMYIEWRSTYNYQTPGWEAEWTSTPGNFPTPSADYVQSPSTLYAGGIGNFAAKNYDANTSYEWFVGGSSAGYGNTLQYLFSSNGQYDVCLIATSCGGVDTVCNSINVINPTAAPTADFKVDYKGNQNACFTTNSTTININLGDTITLIDLSDQGPYQWNWSGSPSSDIVWIGNQSDQNVDVTFSKTGTYDITLDATNGIGTGTTTKTAYIVVGGGYCTPSVSTLISDLGINGFSVGQLNNQSNAGVDGYKDFSNLYSTCMAIGGKYAFSMTRNSAQNPINRKIWIDLNQDGDFADAGENVATQAKTSAQNWNDTIFIPSSATLGKTRMRIATSFSAQTNSACGPNQFGEFEDYTVYIMPDVEAPIITILGNNPSFIEKGKSYVDDGATAWDAVDGNVSVTVSGLPSGVPSVDTFWVSYDAQDLSGNQAATAKRMVIVKPDQTGPVITLTGSNNYYVEVNNAWNDPGATAYDSVTGSVNSANITVTGSVNTSVLGQYILTYTACDAYNNCSSVQRIVTVGDTTKPVLTMSGNNPMNMTVGSSFTDPGVSSVTDNYWNNLTYTTSTNLNVNVIGTYQVIYSSTDGSGNVGTVTRTVVVVDDVAPTITFFGGDTLVLEAVKGISFVDPGFYATDNYYPTVTWNNSGTVTIDKTTLDQYQTLTYSCTDGSGNTTNKTRVVVVRKTTKPWVTLIGNALDQTPWGTAYTDPGVNKNDLFYDAADLTLNVTGTVDHTIPGVYELKYTLTDPKGNTSLTVSRAVQVVVRQGINEVANSNSVNVYPNPSNGIVNIQLIGDVKYNSIVVTNTLGQTISNINVSVIGGTYTIDLSNQASGMYFINLRNENSVVVKKVKLINN